MTQIKNNQTREGMPVHIIATREGKTKSRENNKLQRYVTRPWWGADISASRTIHIIIFIGLCSIFFGAGSSENMLKLSEKCHLAKKCLPFPSPVKCKDTCRLKRFWESLERTAPVNRYACIAVYNYLIFLLLCYIYYYNEFYTFWKILTVFREFEFLFLKPNRSWVETMTMHNERVVV